MTKKSLVIGLAALVVLGLSTVTLAFDMDVGGGGLSGATVTAGTDSGTFSVDVYEYTTFPTIGSHHWFYADGGFDATVSVTPGSPGSGLMRTDMYGKSRSPATFTGGGSQNFDATAAWPNNTWGMIQYYVSGTDSAELNTAIGTGGSGTGFHRTINGNYYTLITGSGEYEARVEAWLFDSTVTPFDTPLMGAVLAGGYVCFGSDSSGSVIWDNYVHPTKTGILSDINGIRIGSNDPKHRRAWHTTGPGYLEQKAWGTGGIGNWNGQSISGPNAYAYQYIYHGSDWDYFAGISAQK